MKPPPSQDPLPQALADWRVAPRRDPHFRAATWQRIAAARAGGSWGVYARAHGLALGTALALAVVFGGWVGREEARSRVQAERARIVTAYVEALDARALAER